MARSVWIGSTGPQGNDWNLGSNWSTGVVPQPGDDVVISSGTPLADLKGVTANVGSVTVDNGGSADLTGQLTVTGDLTDNGGVGVDTSFLVEFGGSTLAIGGMLTVTNSGAGFTIGNRAQTSATKVIAGSVTNTGAINIAGNANGGALAELDVASVAGFGGFAGVLTGNINLGIGSGGAGGPGDALLDFVGGGLINTIEDGSVQLNGALAFIASGNATSSNSALAGPLTIGATGALGLQGGASVTTQALTDAGSISVDTAFLGIGGSTLTVAGLFTVTGNLGIGRDAMTVASAAVTASGGLANSGSISLNGDHTAGFQGILDVGTTAGFGTAGVLTGNVQLTGFSLLHFAGGVISSIERTGTLVIDGPNTFLASGGATSSNSALTGLATMNGFFTLADGAALTTNNDLSVGNGVNFSNLNVDTGLGAGGSVLHLGGTLTVNSFGGVSIGNGGMTAATAVTANALNFAGTSASSITLNGATAAFSGTAQSTLSVASFAGFGTTGILSGGDLTLVGKTLLDFTLGGQITATAFGANLTIDGADGFLASGNATSSNSALTGLTAIGGNVALHDGALVATAGDLTVGDGIHGIHLAVDSGAGLAVGGTLLIDGVGNLEVDAGGSGGGTLAISGTLNNAGGLTIGNVHTTLATTASAAGLANGGALTIAGASNTNTATLSLGGAATNFGSVIVSGFAVLDDGANIYNQAAGSTMVAGTLDAASVEITGGTLELAVGGVLNGGIVFGSPTGQLKIDGTTMPSNTISSFSPGDTIDLAGVAFSAAGTVSLQSGNVLQVSENGSTFNLNFDPAQDFSNVSFQLAADSSGGTLVNEMTACFCRGTRIKAERGGVPVEELAVGDRVETLSGVFKPIVWIGFGRDLVTRANRLARPVVVRRGALADNVPRRDLYLTHGHALYCGGALIPVEHLVNHRSIEWDETARVIEYYHIELEEHDVVFAEGAPAESYYDARNRAAFQNTREGSLAGGAKSTFAPVLNSGEIVERVWAELFKRAGGHIEPEVTDDADIHLVVDGVRREPAGMHDGIYTFSLEGPAGSLRLRSRSGVPSLLGLGRSDHRPLGVAIKQIVLHHEGIPTYFDYDGPQFREGGCYHPEDGYCWTDGEFDVPARFFALLNGAFTLEIHTAPHYDMRYPIAERATQAA